MEWDELRETDRTWRVRVRLADRPGQLAILAKNLSERGCNLLGVAVLPVAIDAADAADAGALTPGAVVDELVLRAPADLDEGELTALVEMAGVRCVGIVAASVGDLVDVHTAALRAASGALSGATSPQEALRRVLGADSVEPATGGPDAADEPGAVRVDAGGHRVTVRLGTGEVVEAARRWAPFTDGELARVPALVELLILAERRARPVTPVQPQHRRQLSTLDAQFLNAETSTTLTHVGGLTILDPSDLPGGRVTVDAVRRLVGGRLHLVAPLRWRLHQVPLGLDLPYWIDSGPVDLTHHIREVHLPEPGTDAQLGEEVARLAGLSLDRERPLWECYLVHGLSGGRQALYTKVHHAVVDGVSGAEVLAVIFDLGPEPRHVPPPAELLRPEQPPGAVELLQRGAVRSVTHPWRVARSVTRALPHMRGLRSGAVPRTPFNGPLTANRTFAFTSLQLSEVKAVKNSLGFTVNDVVMALCTSALRRWLIEHDALPASPLVSSIPVSVRTSDQVGTAGNQISFMLTDLPTHEPDPVQRLAALHASLAAAKRRFTKTPARLLHDCSALIPQVLHGVASRTLLRMARLGAPPFNLFVSNVPGPQLQLYAAGARVTGNFPVSVVSDIGGGINITVMSYNGHLDFGIIACREMVPDVWGIAGYLHDALAELTELTELSEVTELTAAELTAAELTAPELTAPELTAAAVNGREAAVG